MIKLLPKEVPLVPSVPCRTWYAFGPSGNRVTVLQATSVTSENDVRVRYAYLHGKPPEEIILVEY